MSLEAGQEDDDRSVGLGDHVRPGALPEVVAPLKKDYVEGVHALGLADLGAGEVLGEDVEIEAVFAGAGETIAGTAAGTRAGGLRPTKDLGIIYFFCIFDDRWLTDCFP